MARVTWAPRALSDLDSIAEFIARDSPRYAAVFVRTALETAERCGEFPEAASIVPEFDSPLLRERLIFRYRMIYRVAGPAGVEIVAIVHGTRQLPGDVGDK